MNIIGADYAKQASSPSYIQLKAKKMGFFKRWLLKSVKEAIQQDREVEHAVPLTISKEPRGIDQPERSINFTIYTANGGRVVETRRYDRQRDRNHQGLYIITNDQDFGKEIDKIITMEALK